MTFNEALEYEPKSSVIFGSLAEPMVDIVVSLEWVKTVKEALRIVAEDEAE